MRILNSTNELQMFYKRTPAIDAEKRTLKIFETRLYPRFLIWVISDAKLNRLLNEQFTYGSEALLKDWSLYRWTHHCGPDLEFMRLLSWVTSLFLILRLSSENVCYSKHKDTIVYGSWFMTVRPPHIYWEKQWKRYLNLGSELYFS